MEESNFKKFIIKIYQDNPKLRPIIRKIRDKISPIKPGFSGWGMSCVHLPPWINHFDSKVFLNSANDIKKFKFNLIKSTGTDKHNIDDGLWRHWIVSYATKYALKFAKNSEINFVECGVGEGVSAFFSLREIVNDKKISKIFKMHLYDAWAPMREKELLKTEISSVGKYSELTIEMTKKNLKEFDKNIIYHEGYIPESFEREENNPESINYIHIDLNSAKPTLDALKFFYPRIHERGIILFDDYGAINYLDTRKMIDEFFMDKQGIMMELPTGQAIYYK